MRDCTDYIGDEQYAQYFVELGALDLAREDDLSGARVEVTVSSVAFR